MQQQSTPSTLQSSSVCRKKSNDTKDIWSDRYSLVPYGPSCCLLLGSSQGLLGGESWSNMCMRLTLVILHFFLVEPNQQQTHLSTMVDFVWNQNTSIGEESAIFKLFTTHCNLTGIVYSYSSMFAFNSPPRSQSILVFVAWRHHWCCVTKKGPSFRWLQPLAVGLSVLVWPLYYRTRSEDTQGFPSLVVRAVFLVTGSNSVLVLAAALHYVVPFFRLGGLCAAGVPEWWVRLLPSVRAAWGVARQQSHPTLHLSLVSRLPQPHGTSRPMRS